MGLLVLKFGGAALATPEAFSFVARLLREKREHGETVVAVVSAMGNTTNELLSLANQVHPSPPVRELDMLVTAGERISMALLAMALDKEGIVGKSFTGSQSGIITTSAHTDAQIIDVRPHRIEETVAKGEVAIIAGFQGVSIEKEITTLGRGGSDTTAVALGIALDAERVEFYKDVDGIFNKDPKTNPDAELFHTLSFDEAFSIADQGAKILHKRAIFLASKNHLPLHVKPLRPSSEGVCGTIVGWRDSRKVDKSFESQSAAFAGNS